jgi:hypothetical protein
VFCFARSESHIVMKDDSIVPVSARKKTHHEPDPIGLKNRVHIGLVVVCE